MRSACKKYWNFDLFFYRNIILWFFRLHIHMSMLHKTCRSQTTKSSFLENRIEKKNNLLYHKWAIAPRHRLTWNQKRTDLATDVLQKTIQWLTFGVDNKKGNKMECVEYFEVANRRLPCSRMAGLTIHPSPDIKRLIDSDIESCFKSHFSWFLCFRSYHLLT